MYGSAVRLTGSGLGKAPGMYLFAHYRQGPGRKVDQGCPLSTLCPKQGCHLVFWISMNNHLSVFPTSLGAAGG